MCRPEQGENFSVVAVFEGFECLALRVELRVAPAEVKRRFGAALLEWEGDLAAFSGAENLLARVGRRGARRG